MRCPSSSPSLVRSSNRAMGKESISGQAIREHEMLMHVDLRSDHGSNVRCAALHHPDAKLGRDTVCETGSWRPDGRDSIRHRSRGSRRHADRSRDAGCATGLRARLLQLALAVRRQGMGQQECLERLGHCRKVLTFTLHHIPVTHDGEVSDRQYDQAAGLQLKQHRVS